MEKTSIIVPVYNTEEYLYECFESIYSQRCKNIEVIAINDGSTDSSVEILCEIKKHHPDLIIINQENKGLGAARNRGFREAKGKYVYFLDSDDTISNVLIEECLKCIEDSDCDVVGFQADIFGDITGRNREQYIYKGKCDDLNRIQSGIEFYMKYNKTIPQLNVPLMFFSKAFLDNSNLSFCEGILHEDVDFYFNLISANPKLILTDKVLYHRRYRHDSIMTTHINNKRAYDLIDISLRVAKKDVPGELHKFFLYDSLKQIRKSLEAISKNSLERVDENDKLIEDFYISIGKDVASADLLTQCEYYLGISFLDCSGKIRDFAKNIVLNKIESLKEKTGLYNDSYKVGIYGTGGVTDIFLNACLLAVGEIPSNIIFIETGTKTGSKIYKGKTVYNYKDVKYDELKLIIVSSERYEDQIIRTLNEFKPNIDTYKITSL